MYVADIADVHVLPDENPDENLLWLKAARRLLLMSEEEPKPLGLSPGCVDSLCIAHFSNPVSRNVLHVLLAVSEGGGFESHQSLGRKRIAYKT